MKKGNGKGKGHPIHTKGNMGNGKGYGDNGKGYNSWPGEGNYNNNNNGKGQNQWQGKGGVREMTGITPPAPFPQFGPALHQVSDGGGGGGQWSGDRELQWCHISGRMCALKSVDINDDGFMKAKRTFKPLNDKEFHISIHDAISYDNK